MNISCSSCSRPNMTTFKRCVGCRIVNRKRSSKFRQQNPAKVSKTLAIFNLRLKTEVFSHYGGPECSLCPETRLGALAIDHINGGGKKHCQTINRLYLWLRRHNYPDGFRVLCANCNYKEYLIHRPISQSKDAIRKRQYNENLKIAIMTALGGHCVGTLADGTICGKTDLDILTVHHINGDGAEHRRMVSDGRCGTAFYCKILKTGDFDGLECRCYSCNDCEKWQDHQIGKIVVGQ